MAGAKAKAEAEAKAAAEAEAKAKAAAEEQAKAEAEEQTKAAAETEAIAAAAAAEEQAKVVSEGNISSNERRPAEQTRSIIERYFIIFNIFKVYLFEIHVKGVLWVLQTLSTPQF